MVTLHYEITEQNKTIMLSEVNANMPQALTGVRDVTVSTLHFKTSNFKNSILCWT
jgi:hypothetical protein